MENNEETYICGDIVDGLWRCGKSLYDTGDRAVISGKIFEWGNGKNYSILDLVDAFGETEVEYIAARPGEVRESLNTDTKAKDMLGWEPKGDIIEFIKDNYV